MSGTSASPGGPAATPPPACGLGGAGCLGRELLETAQEPMALLDGELRLRAANCAFFLAFGLSQDRAVGRPLLELGAGEWASPSVRELLARACTQEEVEAPELVLVSPAAGRRRVRARVRALRRGPNRTSAFVLSLVVLPGAEAPAAPAAAAVAAPLAADLVAVFDRAGRCLEALGSTEELLGLHARELTGSDVGALVMPEDLERLRPRLVEAVRARAAVRVELRVRRPHAQPLRMEARVRPARDPLGRRIFQVALRDVTERHRAEQALRWLARQSKQVLDTAAEGIFGVDTSGRITFVNPAAGRLLGLPVEDLLGRPCADVVRTRAADPRTSLEAAVEKSLRHGISLSSPEARLLPVRGEPMPVEYTCAPMREGEAVLGAVVTFRDISERLRSEAALRRAEWLSGVGETALAIRHEINNPLTTLLAEAALLEMGGNTPAEERESIAAMIQEARRIGEVLRRLAQRQYDPPVRVEAGSRMVDLR